MKFLGKIKDPKDLTTKEYVDNADKELQEDIDAHEELLEDKVDRDEIVSFTTSEIKELWSKYINQR